MDPSQTSSPPAGSEESATQQQARLRRERREAKIKAGGSSRLDRITQVSGRPAESAPPPQTAFPDPADDDPSALPPRYPTSNSDSTNNDSTNNAPPTEADIRALLRAGAPPPGVDTAPEQPAQDEDPMMRMLQQLMGGLSGEDGQPSEGLPPALAAMLGGGGAPGPTTTKGSAGAPAISAQLWRILHAVSALALGIYLAAHTSFVSTPRLMDARSTAPPPASSVKGVEPVSGGDMFWMFAGAELVLQGSRMVLERGEGREMGGWVGMVGGMLPEPWRGWVRLGMRYRGIWGTVVEDGMVVVWVLGCVGWWRGMGG